MWFGIIAPPVPPTRLDEPIVAKEVEALSLRDLAAQLVTNVGRFGRPDVSAESEATVARKRGMGVCWVAAKSRLNRKRVQRFDLESQPRLAGDVLKIEVDAKATVPRGTGGKRDRDACSATCSGRQIDDPHCRLPPGTWEFAPRVQPFPMARSRRHPIRDRDPRRADGSRRSSFQPSRIDSVVHCRPLAMSRWRLTTMRVSAWLSDADSSPIPYLPRSAPRFLIREPKPSPPRASPRPSQHRRRRSRCLSCGRRPERTAPGHFARLRRSSCRSDRLRRPATGSRFSRSPEGCRMRLEVPSSAR